MLLPGTGTEGGAPYAAQGYQTQIHPGSYYVAPAVAAGRGTLQAWSISSLVLSLLCLATYGLLSLGVMFAVSRGAPGASGLLLVFMGFGAIAAATTTTGSIGALAGKEWGRQALIAGAIAAISFLVIDFIFSLTNAGPSLGGSGSAFAGFGAGFKFGAIFGDLGKMLYCALLLRFMLSAAARDAVRA